MINSLKNCSVKFNDCISRKKICFIIPERDYVLDEDFMKAVRKVAENKKLETKLDYKPI